MRRPFILAAGILTALTVALPALGQTADEIVAMNLKAKGGAEKLKAISGVKITGKLAAQLGEVPMTVFTKRPNMVRQELSMPAGKAIVAFDGTTAWMIPPGGVDPKEVTGPQADSMRKSADFDTPFLDYAARGFKVALVGKEKVRDAEVYHLTLMRKEGSPEHYYIDTKTMLEVKRTSEVDAGGGKQTLESELSDYKPVDGMMVPHTMKQSVNGAPIMQMTIEKLEFNTPMDDAFFRMPAKR